MEMQMIEWFCALLPVLAGILLTLGFVKKLPHVFESSRPDEWDDPIDEIRIPSSMLRTPGRYKEENGHTMILEPSQKPKFIRCGGCGAEKHVFKHNNWECDFCGSDAVIKDEQETSKVTVSVDTTAIENAILLRKNGIVSLNESRKMVEETIRDTVSKELKKPIFPPIQSITE